MVARRLTLVAVALVTAGCGSATYSAGDAARAAHGRALPPSVNHQPFATWDAVTELRIDLTPPTGVWGARNLVVYRFATVDEAVAFVDALGELAGPVVRRANLVLAGGRAAIAAALRRLP